MITTHHPTLEDFAFPTAHARVLAQTQRQNIPETIPSGAPFARNILALDLGTATGYALRRRDGSMSYGTEKFPDRKRAHPGQRIVDFRYWLAGLLEREQIHVLAFENVVFGHSSSAASKLYGAFWGQMLACCAVRNIDPVGVAVPTVKKAWTGAGNADKAAMIAEAKRRGFRPDSDNAADALAVLAWAAMQEAEECES